MFQENKDLTTDNDIDNLPKTLAKLNSKKSKESIESTKNNENNIETGTLLENSNLDTLTLEVTEMSMFTSSIQVLVEDKNIRKLILKIPPMNTIVRDEKLDSLIKAINKSSVEYLDLTNANFTLEALCFFLTKISQDEGYSKLLKVIFDIKKYPNKNQEEIITLHRKFKIYAELNENIKIIRSFLNKFFEELSDEDDLIDDLKSRVKDSHTAAWQYIKIFDDALDIFKHLSLTIDLKKYNLFFYSMGINKLLEISALYKLIRISSYDRTIEDLATIFDKIIFARMIEDNIQLSTKSPITALEREINQASPIANLITLIRNIQDSSIEQSVVAVFKYLISNLVQMDNTRSSLLSRMFFDIYQVYSVFKKTIVECQTLTDLNQKVEGFLNQRQDKLELAHRELFTALTSYKIVMTAVLAHQLAHDLS